MNISYIISKRVREILKDKELTQYQLEMLSGISHSTISCLMNNRYNAVNLKTLFIIIQALNITVLEFFDNPLFLNLDNIHLD